MFFFLCLFSLLDINQSGLHQGIVLASLYGYGTGVEGWNWTNPRSFYEHLYYSKKYQFTQLVTDTNTQVGCLCSSITIAYKL